MNRITRFILVVLSMLVGGSTVAWGQTSSTTSNQMALVITPFLSCTPTRGIDFGTHTRNQGPLFTSLTNYAEWDCDTDPNNSINITFTLPSAMTNPQATSLTVPLTYGNTAGF